MSVWKCTFLFGASKYGWTEAFFREAASGEEALAVGRSLADARAGLLGDGAALIQVVVSLTTSWRTTLAANGPALGYGVPADSPIKGLRVRLTASSGRGGGGVNRSYLIRALPAGFLPPTKDVRWTYQPALMAKVQSFLDLLKSGGWMLKGTDKSQRGHRIGAIAFVSAAGGDWFGDPLPPQQAEDGNTLACLQFDDGGTIPAIDPSTGAESTVLVRNVLWKPKDALKAVGLNGEHLIAMTGPGTVWVVCDEPADGSYVRGGVVSLRSERYWPVSRWSISGPAAEKCGAAPRLLQRGPVETAALKPGPGPGVTVSVSKGPPTVPAPVIHETLSNARELAEFVFHGYDLQPDASKRPIAIAPIVNQPHLWLVALSGLDNATEQSTDVLNAIAAGTGQRNFYLSQAFAAIVATVPAGDGLFVAGHSLGGLNAQLLAIDNRLAARNPVKVVVTFGAFQNVPSVPGVRYIMFREPGEILEKLDRYYFDIRRQSTLVVTPIQPSQPGLSDVVRHGDYPFAPELETYNPDGSLRNQFQMRPLQLGPITEVPAPTFPD